MGAQRRDDAAKYAVGLQDGDRCTIQCGPPAGREGVGKHGDASRTACIGPAGEKLVKYAAVVSDRRTAGRCGTGTVMGSKNLKAVTVTAKRHLDLADPETYNKVAKEQVNVILNNKGFLNHKEKGNNSENH